MQLRPNACASEIASEIARAADRRRLRPGEYTPRRLRLDAAHPLATMRLLSCTSLILAVHVAVIANLVSLAFQPENHNIFSPHTSSLTGVGLPPLAISKAFTRLGLWVDRLSWALKPPSAALMTHLSGYQATQAIGVLAELRVAEALEKHAGADGLADVVAVAETVGANADALRRLLRLLAAKGIIASDGSPSTLRFGNTPISALLKKDAQGSLWGAAMIKPADHYEGWSNLRKSVVDGAGTIAFDDKFGMSVWDYYAKEPSREQAFAAFMSGVSLSENYAIATSGFDFGQACSGGIVDVGGGHGSLLAEVVTAFPTLKGKATVVDLPGVVATAPKREGVDFVGGDFFDASTYPKGGANCFSLKVVLHDWSGDQAVAILKEVKRLAFKAGVAPKALRLLVAEQVLTAGDALAEPKLGLDVNMMVMTGGRERTVDEWAWLFLTAGWSLRRTYASRGLFSLMESWPIEADA